MALVTGRLGSRFQRPPIKRATAIRCGSDGSTDGQRLANISRLVGILTRKKTKEERNFPVFIAAAQLATPPFLFPVESSGRGRFLLNKRFKRSTQTDIDSKIKRKGHEKMVSLGLIPHERTRLHPLCKQRLSSHFHLISAMEKHKLKFSS